jgi:hypothetical protein
VEWSRWRGWGGWTGPGPWWGGGGGGGGGGGHGRLLLIGGRRQQPVQMLEPGQRGWTTRAAFPIEVHHLQPVELGGKVYVLGGLTGGFPRERPVPGIWSYDPAADKWTQVAEIPVDRRRGSAGVVVHEGWIYLVCGIRDGHRGGFVPWLDRWNPASGVWERLPDAPRARDHFSAVVVGGKIVAAGGRTTSEATGQIFQLTVPEVDIYDIGTKTWTTLPTPIPTARAGTAAVAFGEYAVVVGGECGTQSKAHDAVEALHVPTGRWHKLPGLLVGRHGMGAVVIGTTLYTTAGSGNRGGGPELTDTESLDLTPLLKPGR